MNKLLRRRRADKVAFSIRKNSAEQTPHEFAATDPVRELTKSLYIFRGREQPLFLLCKLALG